MGTRKNYQKLNDLPAWPDNSQALNALAEFTSIIEGYDVEQAAAGTFESKLQLVLTKFKKVITRHGSANHHLRVILNEYKRTGSNDLKRDIARAVADEIEAYQQEENEIISEILKLTD